MSVNNGKWPQPQLVRLLDERLRQAQQAVESSEFTDGSIRSLLQSFMDGYPLVPAKTTITGAWRAQKHKRGTCINYVQRLWYPPAKNVKQAGRLNRTGQSLGGFKTEAQHQGSMNRG